MAGFSRYRWASSIGITGRLPSDWPGVIVGIRIDRRKKHNVVDRVVQAFGERDKFVIGIAPEGTRSHTSRWKTGFYRIAEGAGVPIQLVKICYKRKLGVLGPLMMPSGDIDRDMELIRRFYADATPRYPEKKGEIRA